MRVEQTELTVTVGVVVFSTHIGTLRNTFEKLKLSTVEVEIVCLCNSPDSVYQNQVRDLCVELGVLCISNQPNRGFGAGHNLIWSQINSKWYICCNPDILVEPSTIERLLRFGESADNPGLLMPKVLHLDGSIQHVVRRDPTPSNIFLRQVWRFFPNAVKTHEGTFDYSMQQSVEFVSGCFFAVKLGLLKRLNGFDEGFFLYAEDADLSRRAREHAINWYIPDAVVRHSWAAGWRRSFSLFVISCSSLIKYWRKHGYFGF